MDFIVGVARSNPRLAEELLRLLNLIVFAQKEQIAQCPPKPPKKPAQP